MPRIRTILTALLIGVAATACGRNAGMESGSAQPSGGAIAVHIDNEYMLAMSVYAAGTQNIPFKLGTVGPGLSSTFTLDPSLVHTGMVQIYAQPPGGGRVVGTGLLTLSPGQTVDFRIGNNLVDNYTSIH